MDLNFTEEQVALRRVARDVFEARSPIKVVRELELTDIGYSVELWREMAKLGWIGMTFPEHVGGAGAGILDLAMVYLEMGRSLAASPHLCSTVICGHVFVDEGTPERLDMARAIAAGELIVSPALMEPSGEFGAAGITMPAKLEGDGGFVLSGTKLFVPFANSAQHVLVAARTSAVTEGISLFVVDAHAGGITLEHMPNVSDFPLYALHLSDVKVPSSAVVGEIDGGWALLRPSLDKAAVLRCAEIVGAGERVLEMTVGYANDRKAFGQAIGTYQAVQYLCTNIAISTHLTDLFYRRAAWLIDEDMPAQAEVAQAKAYSASAAERIVREAHEVFAGLGFMMEHDLQLFTRRAKHWEFDLGDARYYRELITASLP